MSRKVFFSFHYIPDNWRAGQARNMGVVEGNIPVSDNDWETITGKGDKAIQNWIDGQIEGKSCTIVLIGENTANRKWINYEIVKTWNEKKGVLGIYIHKLKDREGKQSNSGSNPFDYITHGDTGKKLSSIVKTYYPTQSVSTDVYAYIKENISDWVEEAIKIRYIN
jgi:hypothetical protein